MPYISSLTSKGQVTIPVEIRKMLNLSTSSRVVFLKGKKEVIIKPAVDFYSLKGSIRSKKKYSDKKADKAIASYIAKNYGKKNKAS